MNKRIANKVLLIGWDAADWQHINPLMEQGLLPGLESLINRGVMGNLATLHPVLSPMLWNSIATGKTADKHGVLGFTQPLRSGKGVHPFPSTSRKVKALWNICHQNDLKSNVVGWWASHPAEPINGCMVSNLFNGMKRDAQGNVTVTPGTFHPAEKSSVLADLKILPDEITGDDILPFIPNAGKVDQKFDPRISMACKLLAECASIQSITTHLIENEPWDLTAVYFDAIDHFCHGFMYYHPPQMRNVKDEDFEIYKDVINGAYRFHDMILQRLLHLVGEDTTVVLCSDHGFQSGDLRPYSTPAEPAGPAAWHRDLGVIVMAGPGIKKDERIYGANIIDITPTILYQLGLPIGEDMDGRVLIDGFEDPVAPTTIPSWESVEGACGMHPPNHDHQNEDMSDEQSQALVKQFVALGYIEDPGEDLERAARNCQLELDYNLARVFLSTNRYQQAVDVLLELVREMPWEDRYWKNLAHCFFELGYIRQAKQVMSSLYMEIKKPPVFARVFLAKCCFELEELDEAKEHLDIALALNPRQPIIYVMVGRIQIKNNDLVAAGETFNRAIEIDNDNAHAWLGLAEVDLRLNRFESAADSALSALAVLYRLERAHWILGVAMFKLKNLDRAKQAFESLLKFKSTTYSVAVHRRLKFIHNQLGDVKKSDEHSLQARQKLSRRREERQNENDRKEKLLDLPSVPSIKERMETHRKERPRPQAGARQKQTPGSSGRTLTLVSGLPRSGTSLMMQMLQAGGLMPMTDGERIADIDNPEGYLEWEAIKKIRKEPELFNDPELDTRAIKVISMLLTNIPLIHRYKVIFMRRPIDEVVASQQKMIDRLGSSDDMEASAEEITERLTAHRDNVLKWLEARKFIDLLVVDYPQLVVEPTIVAAEVAKFLGPDRIQSTDSMLTVVKPELYRQKRTIAESFER